MNPNLQNTTAALSRPADPEKGPLDGPFPAQGVLSPSPAIYLPVGGHEAVAQDLKRKRRRRRFWHFITGTLLLLLFWHLVAFDIASFITKLTARPWTPNDDCRFPLTDQSMAQPSQCEYPLNWTKDSRHESGHWPLHAHASLTLPIDAEELLFVYLGSLAQGTFEVSQSVDLSDDAVVNVDVWYSDRTEHVLGESSVCYLHPSDGQHGLGIFTPNRPYHSPHDYLKFWVHLSLPASGSDAPLWINKLSTNLPEFAHRFAELSDAVIFKTLSLATRNVPIVADSLTADHAVLRSTNGQIRGTFTSNSSLDLTTRNAAIHATVYLNNEDEQKGTILRVSTANAAIKANVHLNADGLDTPGGAFRVDARSSNGPVDLAFAESPANSLLNASAVSSNAPVRVAAHPAFEGTFELHSSWYTPPSVIKDRPVEDPLGERRRRNVQVNTTKNRAIRGQVDWVPKHDGAKNGHIGLETSNSPATLIL
ncbi:hypothetical protein BD414DRAFT_495020 [Trametes punicea]|nr:hypothetical protein BD414DRAFT_495020 [Trametes punicea]